KQLLNIVGRDTMLQQTAARLKPLFRDKQLWIVTNAEQVAQVKSQLSKIPRSQILSEPMGRNTAAAIALAAFNIRHATKKSAGDALMAVLPADHFIADSAAYRRIVSAALEVASALGQMVVLGIPPAFPETGFGYIERGAATHAAPKTSAADVFDVERFTEKPPLETAREYVSSGKYFWNAGMFFWRVSTFLDNLQRFLPKTYEALAALEKTIGTRRYPATLKRIYASLQNISVDYAILEPATKQSGPRSVSVIPATIGWSDIGSWDAVYQLLAKAPGENVSTTDHVTIGAEGNFIWAPKNFVAAVGVNNLAIIETADALLVCARERAQEVGQVVKWLEERKRRDLL
ncbi:MAG TPA: sugar phosphate nucleotidyltransferase, partial [Candidatus Acidoferrales bacterium]|nr:sugar phosphate nucleotidyltransferase [Candidatus Acidoferrales bacterium]